MRIKDLRNFREFFKKYIRESSDTNRDVHFIGTDYYDEVKDESIYGFFDIYHGQKSKGKTDGIKGFLKGFLDMAQDAQAVYEFLQNAVDADSSHFLMVWDKDDDDIDENGNPAEYLMVLNNGKQFDFSAIESILNVGVSQKLEQEHTIGKFGIGFKLAHRLVGKENGLEELVENNYGPILYSWTNNELEKFLLEDNLVIEPIKQDFRLERSNGSKYVRTSTQEAWLLKILISNFPTQPDELIRDAYYREKNDIFTTKDVNNIRRWLLKYKHIIPLKDYLSGSMFFLKLGTDKAKTLKGDYVLEGIKFSMSILSRVSNLEVQGLKHVHINGTDIENVPLEFESIEISKNSEEYNFIRFGKKGNLTITEQIISDKDTDIQFLFGYTDYLNSIKVFENVPNFYLYFPLTEEKHDLKFILHTNAFYKKSARTSLHSDEINIRLLKVFSDKLIQGLLKNQEKFIKIYPLLLSTKKSIDNDKLWINEPLIVPILDFVASYIPVQSDNMLGFEIVNDKNNVRLKKTKVDVYKNLAEAPFQWFYFEGISELEISIFNNLNLKSFTLYHLLLQKNIYQKINLWLDESQENIKIFIEEMNSICLDGQIDKNAVKENLFKLRFLRFTNNEVFSIEEFQEREHLGYLYKLKEFEGTYEILQKLGFYLTVDRIEPLIEAFRNNFTNKSQLKDYVSLVELFSNKVEDKQLELLSNFEKNNLLAAFEAIHRKSEKHVLPYVKLYKNNIGKYQLIKNLVNYEKGFLNFFSIDKNQLAGLGDSPNILKYLKFDSSHIYENIFNPLWRDVLNLLCENSQLNVRTVFGEIEYSYKSSTWGEKASFLLSQQNLIIYKGEVTNTDKVCFYKNINFDIEKHEIFQKVALGFFQTYLPDLKFLEIFSEIEPFGFKNRIGHLLLELKNLDAKEVSNILEFCKTVNINIFQDNVILENGNQYDISSNNIQKQYFSLSSILKNIVNEKLPHKFKPLPQAFLDFGNLVINKEKILFDSVIQSLSEINSQQESLDVLQIVLLQDELTQQNYFENLKEIVLNLQDSSNSNSLWLQLIYNVRNLFSKEEIQQKIILVSDDVIINIYNQPYFLEKLMLNNYEIKYRDLIPSLNNGNEFVIKGFIDKFINKSDFSQSFFKELFKIQENVSLDTIKSDFLNHISEDYLLVNIYQLYFIVTSKLFNTEEILKFKILNINFQAENITSPLYSSTNTNRQIVKNSHILFESYSLEEPNMYNQVALELSLKGFLFHKDFKINKMSAYENLRSDISNLEKIDFMYEAYLNTPENERHIEEDKIEKYLNFRDDLYYIFDGNYGSNDFSKEIIEWIDGNQIKKVFLKKLNFIFEEDALSTMLKICNGENIVNHSIDSFSEKEFTKLLSFLYANKIEIALSNNAAVILIKTLFQKYSTIIDVLYVPSYKTINSLVLRDAVEVFKIDDDIIDLLGKDDLYLSDWNRLIEQKAIMFYDINPFFNCSKIEFELELNIDNAEELKTYYYNEWKRDVHNLKLYEADNLKYKVTLNFNDHLYVLGYLSKYQHCNIIPVGNSLKLFFTKDLTIHFLAKTFEFSDEFEFYNLSLNLKKLEEKYIAFNLQITEALKNTAMEELRDMFEAQIKKQERDNKREDIITRIAELNETNLKYSKQWFIEYLEYLKTFEESLDNTEFKTIRFRKIEKLNERGFYRLSSANAYIPENIDESKNDSINVIYSTNKKEKVELQFISKKNQDLIIKTSRNFTDSEIKNIFLLELIYIPNIDLLSRLEAAFKNLDSWDDYKSSFPCINYIYGPPGTGKTTEIKKIIAERIENNANAKILVLTPTNKACDVIANRIFKEGITSFFRVSGPTSDDIPEEYYKSDLNLSDLYANNVFISTIHRFPYYNWGSNHEDYLRNQVDFWDDLIIDEASMITLPYITFACMCAIQKNKKINIVIAGDPKQIPPIPELSDNDLELINSETENIYSMFGLNSFEVVEQNKIKRPIDNILNLPTQYRSVPDIGNLFNDFSYNGNVASNRKESDLKIFPKPIGNLFVNPVNFLSVNLNSDDPLYSHNKLIYSSYHIYTTILIVEILKFMEKNADVQNNINPEERWSVGVISPYKGQAVIINKLIGDYGFEGKIKILADTVHGFQGDDCDIIFYLVTPNGNRFSGDKRALLSKDYIYNVAISRAKDYLVIVHPFQDVTNNFHINEIYNIANQRKGSHYNIISSSEIEMALFNEKKFIDQRTLVGSHDEVNIYTDFNWRYYVKRSSTAIDIQVNLI